MDTPGTEHQAETAPVPQAPLFAKFLVVAFALSYISFTLYLVMDCWVHEQEMLKRILGLPAEKTLPPIFLSAVYSVLGALLGAGALDIVSFHRYVAVKRDFQAPHVWGYFVAPWLAAVLGLIVFALLQSGLLIFAGASAGNSNSEISQLGYLTVGFLSGFGWFQAIEKIREVISRFFAASPREAEQERKPGPPISDDHQTSTAGAGGAAQEKITAPGTNNFESSKPARS